MVLNLIRMFIICQCYMHVISFAPSSALLLAFCGSEIRSASGSAEIRISRLPTPRPTALTWSWRGSGVVGGTVGGHHLREQQQQRPTHALLAAKREPQGAPTAHRLQVGVARPPEDGGPATDGLPQRALAREQRADTRPRAFLPHALARRRVRRVGNGWRSSDSSRLGLPEEERGGFGGHGEAGDALERLSGAEPWKGRHAAGGDYRGGRIGCGRGCGAVRRAWPAGTNRWLCASRNRSGDCTQIYFQGNMNTSIRLAHKIMIIDAARQLLLKYSTSPPKITILLHS